MIVKQPQIEKEFFLTQKRELIESQREEGFETLFAQEYQKAKESGKKEGERIGYERAQNEMGSLMLLVKRLSENLMEQKKRFVKQMQPEISELVLIIAEKVIRQSLKDPEVMSAAVLQLLDLAINAFSGETLKIFVSPQDCELLQIDGVTFLADQALAPGDCRIEARSGIINGQVKRLLEDMAC
ncbi:MAG: hypothetical protein S4CHLAM81_02480 [Chlamydiales bacterium]|nr:hypothetical protein [Chlamydiales bacterium]MCH9635040.1 hypothetical protein [Chlamydiales bacterium]MCH9703647.1 hypothetical protein [Chlamydiota bacterium]